MASVAFLKGSSVALTAVGDEDDYNLLLQWSATAAGVYASGAKPNLTLAEMKAYVQQPDTRILIIRTNEGRPIGCLNWKGLAYEGSIEMGCMIGDDTLWGAGYGMEALILVMDYQFHERNVHRIQFLSAAFNKPVIRMLCSGFAHIDGILRDYFFLDGDYHDAVIASILRDEYYSMLRSTNMSPTDAVSDADKDQARSILAKHLADHPITIS